MRLFRFSFVGMFFLVVLAIVQSSHADNPTLTSAIDSLMQSYYRAVAVGDNEAIRAHYSDSEKNSGADRFVRLQIEDYGGLRRVTLLEAREVKRGVATSPEAEARIELEFNNGKTDVSPWIQLVQENNASRPEQWKLRPKRGDYDIVSYPAVGLNEIKVVSEAFHQAVVDGNYARAIGFFEQDPSLHNIGLERYIKNMQMQAQANGGWDTVEIDVSRTIITHTSSGVPAARGVHVTYTYRNGVTFNPYSSSAWGMGFDIVEPGTWKVSIYNTVHSQFDSRHFMLPQIQRGR